MSIVILNKKNNNTERYSVLFSKFIIQYRCRLYGIWNHRIMEHMKTETNNTMNDIWATTWYATLSEIVETSVERKP